jgi:prepilin-type N-terminal cleavage/methylation domain-containing protein
MKLKTTEKGFTLIELLVGLSIAAFVVGAASMTVITMMRLTPQTNNWAIALHQVQNAGHWISHDVQMSQGNITVGDGNPIFLTLTVPYESGGTIDSKEIVYQFETLSGQEWLTRTDGIDGKTTIAQYISDAAAEPLDPDTHTLTFTITATSGNVPVTRNYEAMQRVPPAPSP